MMSIDKDGAKRVYVLDTNVLIHDPTAPLNFDEHRVIIPMAVLEELDGMKQEQSDRARQARQATRLLDDLMENQPLENYQGIPSIILPVPESADHEPGTLRFAQPRESDSIGLDSSIKDNQILATAFGMFKEPAVNGSGGESTRRVILVTNDTNMRVKAAAIGLPAEGYRNDAVFTDSDAMIDGCWIAAQGVDFWSLFEEAGPADGHDEAYTRIYRFKGEPVAQWYPGMMVSDDGETFRGRVLSIEENVAHVALLNNFHNSNGVWGVNARDDLQNFAMNLLLDPEIDLVTLAGPAGTGKTFLALACALKMVFDENLYEKLIITREAVPMGEEIGFLPGNEEEKMAPWCGAFIDNIEQLVGLEKNGKGAAGMELIKKRLQMRSLGLMRGRTFTDAILIIDEAQNLSPKQMKNLVTRAGRNTKVICLGNVAQIDAPYLNPGSTGLANLVQKFRSWPHAGHVTLRGVERSRLAAHAEEVL